MKVDVKIVLIELFCISPLAFSLLSLIDGGFAVKYVFAFTIMCFGYFVVKVASKKRLYFVLTVLISMIYFPYLAYISGASSLINVYFYSYILLFSIEIFCFDTDFRNSVFDYCVNNRKRYIYYTIGIFIIIVISVLFFNGYRRDSSSTYFLFGPFSIPHTLAYIMLAVYCGISLGDQDNRKAITLLLKVITVTCIVLSAVRSATLGAVILMMVDLFSTKNRSKKITVIMVGIILFVLIATQTDFLTNNPLLIKTQYAASVGGSMTSGRELYREIAITRYLNDGNIIHKLLGVGMDGVIMYLYEALSARIQAHNDYVNTLVAYGALGILIFVAMQIRLCMVIKNRVNAILCGLFMFLLAYFNGFVLYVMLTCSLPIIVCYFEKKTIEINVKKIKIRVKPNS